MKNKIFGALIVVMLVTAAVLYFLPPKKPPAPTETQPSPPAPSITDEIRVIFPEPNALVTSPLNISGEARGTWFFEANMPVSLLDASGKAIPKEGFVTSTEEWMTTDFVPFEGTLIFAAPTSTVGFLRFQQDNPRGDPTFPPKSFIIPVRFR